MDKIREFGAVVFRFFAFAGFFFAMACSDGKPPPNSSLVAGEPTRTDTARINKAVQNIRVRPHFIGPEIRPELIFFPFFLKKEGAATINVKNDTDCNVNIFMQGPTPRVAKIGPKVLHDLYVAEGQYDIVLDPRPCANILFPAFLEGSFQSGRKYTLPINAKEIASGGEFVLQNSTGSNVRVAVAGNSHTVGGASAIIPLPEGFHNVTVTSSSCGSRTDRIQIKKGQRLALEYGCQVTYTTTN